MRIIVNRTFTHEAGTCENGSQLDMDMEEAFGLRRAIESAGGMLLHALDDIPSHHVAKGDLVVMDRAKALHLLDTERWDVLKVEPLLCPQPHVAAMDGDLSVQDAYVFQVKAFAEQLDCLEDAMGKPNLIYLKAGRVAPRWDGQRQQRRRTVSKLAGYGSRDRGEYYLDDWDDPRDRYRTPRKSQEELYAEEWIRCITRLARKNFLDALADDRLVAYGVAEPDFYKNTPSRIPRTLWDRDVVLNLQRSELREILPDNRRGERRFSRIIVRQPDRQTSMVSAETDCKKWLKDLATSGDKPGSKENLLLQAQEKFPGLSKEAFGRAWETEAPESWKAAGRPSTKKSNPSPN